MIVDGKKQLADPGNIVTIPPNTWHEFKNRSDYLASMVNIHPVPKMIQEDWGQR